MIFSLLPTIHKDGNNPFNFKTHVSFRNISKNCSGDNVSTKSLSIYILEVSNIISKLAISKKMIYTVFLKAFWIAFSSKQAAGVSWCWGKGKEARFPFLCACNKQQNSKVTPVSWYSAVLSASRRSI